jgi:MFS family permease
MALAAVTIGLLAVGHSLWGVAATIVVWGTLNSAIPVAWSTWLSKGIRDEPESGGGLMVGTIQLAIMLGAGVGGLLLDHLSIAATFIGSAVLLAIASVAVGNGESIRPAGYPERNDRRSRSHKLSSVNSRRSVPVSFVPRQSPSSSDLSLFGEHKKVGA